MTDHTALIERLEKAESGNRELDALIWLHLNRPEYTGGVRALEMRGWYDGRGHLILETDAGEEVADGLGIGIYTTSIDAALALVERVLPGWGYFLRKDKDGCNCGLVYPDACFVTPGCGSSPALAILIALLKAIPAAFEGSVGTQADRPKSQNPQPNSRRQADD